MSKYLAILFLVFGCATVSKINREIMVDKEIKESVDATLKFVQDGRYLLPVHVLKSVKVGEVPQGASCVVEKDGVVITIDKEILTLTKEEQKDVVQLVIFKCLTPRPEPRSA